MSSETKRTNVEEVIWDTNPVNPNRCAALYEDRSSTIGLCYKRQCRLQVAADGNGFCTPHSDMQKRGKRILLWAGHDPTKYANSGVAPIASDAGRRYTNLRILQTRYNTLFNEVVRKLIIYARQVADKTKVDTNVHLNDVARKKREYEEIQNKIQLARDLNASGMVDSDICDVIPAVTTITDTVSQDNSAEIERLRKENDLLVRNITNAENELNDVAQVLETAVIPSFRVEEKLPS